MLEIKNIRLILRIILVLVGAFILNKFLIRPFVLENSFSGFWEVFVLSFPNFCEAVIGSLLLTNIALVLNQRLLSNSVRLKAQTIYPLTVGLAAIYVILQELKIHNLGGRNVYDPYDLLFSIIGLVVAYLLLLKIKPTIKLPIS